MAKVKGWRRSIRTSNINTYNRNFSFHLGFNVCGRTEVAFINLAGTADEMLSRCSRLSFRLKLNRKLYKQRWKRKYLCHCVRYIKRRRNVFSYYNFVHKILYIYRVAWCFGTTTFFFGTHICTAVPHPNEKTLLTRRLARFSFFSFSLPFSYP